MRFALTLFLFLSSVLLFAQNPMGVFKNTTLVNNIESSYYNTKPSILGCSFLIEFNNTVYAITAKNVLLRSFLNDTNSMVLNTNLLNWKMQVKNDPIKYVTLGKLLNINSDSLIIGYLNLNHLTNTEYLVFSIKENNSGVSLLKIRTTKLEGGEPLYVLGWTDLDKDEPQKTFIYTYTGAKQSYINMRKINAPESIKGIEGAPVVDSNGLLVGVVLGENENKTTGEKYIMVGNTDYVLEFLTK